METSNTVINTTLYDRIQPRSMLCWLRVIIANRLATDGPRPNPTWHVAGI